MSALEETNSITDFKSNNEESYSDNDIGSEMSTSISTKENEMSSETNIESKDCLSSSESLSDSEESLKKEVSIIKRIKVEEEPKPVPFANSFGSKAIFGSAAKSIVSFNSIGISSDFPTKNLFAEDTAENPVASEAKKTETTEHELITGEEDETTLSSVKGKLFEFISETKDWHERGVGMFKLNKSKNTNKHRIIMRTDGVQKLILNSNLFPEMICEIVQEKNIRFSANNFESKIQTFILRTKSVDEATTLEKSLKEVINATKTIAENC